MGLWGPFAEKIPCFRLRSNSPIVVGRVLSSIRTEFEDQGGSPRSKACSDTVKVILNFSVERNIGRFCLLSRPRSPFGGERPLCPYVMRLGPRARPPFADALSKITPFAHNHSLISWPLESTDQQRPTQTCFTICRRRRCRRLRSARGSLSSLCSARALDPILLHSKRMATPRSLPQTGAPTTKERTR